MRKLLILAAAAAFVAGPAFAQTAGITLKIEDTDGDGQISSAELDAQAGPVVGAVVRRLTDADRDGAISSAESARPVSATLPLPGATMTFNNPLSQFDLNKDGLFDASEQAVVRAAMPAALRAMWDRTIAKLDVNSDGTLSASEYAAGMAKAR